MVQHRSLRFTDCPSICACSESSLTNPISWEYGYSTHGQKIEPFQASRFLVFDQKQRGPWGRECISLSSCYILLHGPLNHPKYFEIYHQGLLIFVASKSLKLSFTLNFVLKCANDLTTISNLLILLSTWVRNLKPFRVNRNRSQNRQTRRKDISAKYLTVQELCRFYIPANQVVLFHIFPIC